MKLVEIGAMIFGAGALWLDNPYLDLMVLFFAGTLAAFFGPVKYGILPQYLKREEVIAGNAMIEMGTFVTILLGTMFGGFLVIDTEGQANSLRLACPPFSHRLVCRNPHAPRPIDHA